jgi:hypothetical protein
MTTDLSPNGGIAAPGVSLTIWRAPAHPDSRRKQHREDPAECVLASADGTSPFPSQAIQGSRTPLFPVQTGYQRVRHVLAIILGGGAGSSSNR